MKKHIQELGQDTLQNIEMGVDSLTGTISLDMAKYLVIAIPYDKGWKAYVDDEPMPIYPANVQYMGLSLDEGDHIVRLEYERPFERLGLVCSGVGVVAFVLQLWNDKRRKRVGL